MVLDITGDLEDYLEELRELNTPITYNLITRTRGDNNKTVKTVGASQVIPAQVNEVGVYSRVVKEGILNPGDFMISVLGTEDIPIGTQVVARGNTCLVIKTSRDNLGIRNTLYLSKVTPNV